MTMANVAHEPNTASSSAVWHHLTRHWLGRLVLAGLMLGAVVWVTYAFTNLLVYLLVGWLLAYLLRPIVDRLQWLGRVPAILLTLAGCIALISLLLTSLLPFLARQVAELSQLISLEALQSAIGELERWLVRFIPIQPGTLMRLLRQGFETLIREQQLAGTVSSILDLFTNLFYAVLVIPFVTFFVLKDGVHLRRSLLQLIPNRYFELTLAILEKLGGSVGRYFRALFLQSLAVATLASVLLYIFGLHFALAVGVFAGIANTIPYFGPLMGFVAGTLVGIAQTGDFSMVFRVLVAMGLTQVVDNVLFQPMIFSRAAQAHPLIILFAVLVGAQLAGIVGMLLAIPVLTVVRTAFVQLRWGMQNYHIVRATSS
ncbi:AI-2E family transporter [Rhodothermus bifroesti]|uniref:AI-2E family transporter n=1 Tax=Rhodothermus marinus TaxID=29549 RepID=A0A7V2F678_RHOMR|nr:AI-2E family transporter [Rhodothermus bifroesti]